MSKIAYKMGKRDGRDAAGKWVKGVSGNPRGPIAGSVKEIVNVAQYARQFTPEAMSALADIVSSGKSESARVRAAEVLLDRGWGKAPQHIQIDVPQMDDATLAGKAWMILEKARRERPELLSSTSLALPQ